MWSIRTVWDSSFYSHEEQIHPAPSPLLLKKISAFLECGSTVAFEWNVEVMHENRSQEKLRDFEELQWKGMLLGSIASRSLLEHLLRSGCSISDEELIFELYSNPNMMRKHMDI